MNKLLDIAAWLIVATVQFAELVGVVKLLGWAFDRYLSNGQREHHR